MSNELNVTLIDAQPYFSARKKLCEVLDHGTKKLAFACAFLTEPGLASIIKHTRNLELPDSFAVFSFEEPTSPQSLAKLFKKYPKNIYVHYGSYLREYEPQFPRGIMHSKLFFASDGVTAKVWCGSHNLTGNALHRKNIEVATLVEGPCDHPYFKDVASHLDGCKSRARNELRARISGTEAITFVVEMEHDDIDGLLMSLKKDTFIKLKPLGTKDQPKLQPNRDYAIRLYKPGRPMRQFVEKLPGLTSTRRTRRKARRPNSQKSPTQWWRRPMTASKSSLVISSTRPWSIPSYASANSVKKKSSTYPGHHEEGVR